MNISVFLHAINDGKVVHLITNKFGALPLVKMEVTDKDAETSKKVKFEIETTAAQRCFRYKMGFNDASDRMRTLLGLSSRKY